MRRFVVTVFDEWVYLSSMYTSGLYEELLGSVDQLSIQAIADAVAGGSVTLTVACETSSDGRTWTAHTTPISAFAIDVEMTNVTVGAVGGGASTPTLGLVRFKVTLAGTNPKARVRLVVCGRDAAKARNGAAMMEEPGRAQASAARPAGLTAANGAAAARAEAARAQPDRAPPSAMRPPPTTTTRSRRPIA